MEFLKWLLWLVESLTTIITVVEDFTLTILVYLYNIQSIKVQ